MLDLPNSTSCTQEQDQLYQGFTGKTCANTGVVFCKKLADCSSNIKETKELLRSLGFEQEWSECNHPNVEVTPEMKVAVSTL